MDLDTSQQNDVGVLCFRCKKPGHFRKDCPTHFVIQSMTIDELQEALELKLAQLDVAPTDPPVQPELERVEHFQAHSK